MKRKLIPVYIPWINNERFTVDNFPMFIYWNLLPHTNFEIDSTEVTENHGIYWMKEK